MKTSHLAFALFIITQLVVWLIGMRDNIFTGSEVLVLTFIVSVFLLLFVNGYNWARWVAIVLLTLYIVLMIAMAFDDFGMVYLLIAFLYGGVVYLLFVAKGETRAKSITASPGELDVIDWHMSEPETQTSSHVDNDGYFTVGGKVYEYPMLVKRYQSVFIDAMLLFIVMIATMVIIGDAPYRQAVMLSLGILFAFVYEPLLTSHSATIGQRLVGIRVRDMVNPEKSISLLQAYIRIIVKGLLGWLSFLTIHFNRQHRAIHDFAGSSVVIKVK